MIDDTTNTEQTPPANDAGRSGRASAYLVVIVGLRVGEMYRLAKDATVLGRSDEADVRLIDDGVSRRHAVLLQHEAKRRGRDRSVVFGVLPPTPEVLTP
jgi:hypothetical protein